jgi:hypothetical protein
MVSQRLRGSFSYIIGCHCCWKSWHGSCSFSNGQQCKILGVCWSCSFWLLAAGRIAGAGQAASGWWQLLLDALQGLLMVWGFTMLCIAW